ncbi:acyl-CoA dehydrogenase family protein [Actinomadura opuntiae]|uniref:acyl-CoA dehydrogenase family protein n=1 Tax=Actinomadura sp. OS1-43 TaxID=604315 RepID=UPI00255AF425|nr:acyl-CoA dehydrogenase family protein [Actinomadura sp. OS1-43]MDL4816398.1 acyl-CoA dehydrogenase family protein [Actinomadura sp. OS1-43]
MADTHDDDLEPMLEAVRDFIRRDVIPREAEIDEKDEVPAELRETAKRMGLFGFTIPEEYGGLGLGVVDQCRLLIEVGYTTPALRSMFSTNVGIAGQVIMDAGTAEQKRHWLPRLASGEAVASFALTEPDAGSDPADLRTSAVRDGDQWVLDGVKRYITNAPIADVFMVFARTDPDARSSRGIAVFIVPADTPGLTVGPRDHKMGQFGAWTADVNLDGVRVPSDAVVGGEAAAGSGFRTAMRCLSNGRLLLAAACVGMCRRLVDESVRFASDRKQGGKPIASHQLVQAMIADSVTDTMAARALVLDAARAYADGSDRRTGPAAAKYFCSEAVGRVADRAVQVHGGAGYMRSVPVERFYRDARLFRIYEGTSQIQQVIIARQTLGAAAG